MSASSDPKPVRTHHDPCIRLEQEGSAFVADTTGAWQEIPCIQEDRPVGNDKTVKWEGLSLQLPSSRLRPHFAKYSVS
jgi:hypothetical protein